MNTKFIITIVLLFTLTNIFSHQEDSKEVLNKGLTIQLSSETDTCYYSEDEIVIYIEFKNEKFRPLIINRNMIVSTKDLLSIDVIKLKIWHDNKLYERGYLDGKPAMPQKRILFKNRTLKISSLLSFRSLTEKIEGIPDYSKLKKSNEDFGAYQLQALYITNTNDTIFSNWITINYVKE